MLKHRLITGFTFGLTFLAILFLLPAWTHLILIFVLFALAQLEFNDMVVRGGYKYEIPLNEIAKATVKKGFLFKRHYHIRFRAERNYHFIIYDMRDFDTALTGASSENVRNFLDTLKMKVNIE